MSVDKSGEKWGRKENVEQLWLLLWKGLCFSPVLGAQGGEKSRTFLIKKIKKYQKKCTFPLDKALFRPIFIVEMRGSTEFPKGEKNGYRLQNL